MIRRKKAVKIYLWIGLAVVIIIMLANLIFLLFKSNGDNYPPKNAYCYSTLEDAAKGGQDIVANIVNQVSSGNFTFITVEEISYLPVSKAEIKEFETYLLYSDENGYTASLRDVSCNPYYNWYTRSMVHIDTKPNRAIILTAYVGGEHVCVVAFTEESAPVKDHTVKDSLGNTFVSSYVENGDNSSRLYITTMKEMPKDYAVFVDEYENSFSLREHASVYWIRVIVLIRFFLPFWLIGLLIIYLLSPLFNKKAKKDLKDVL